MQPCWVSMTELLGTICLPIVVDVEINDHCFLPHCWNKKVWHHSSSFWLYLDWIWICYDWICWIDLLRRDFLSISGSMTTAWILVQLDHIVLVPNWELVDLKAVFEMIFTFRYKYQQKALISKGCRILVKKIWSEASYFFFILFFH